MQALTGIQDAKELMGKVREMSFALEESDQAAEHLANELAASQVALTPLPLPNPQASLLAFDSQHNVAHSHRWDSPSHYIQAA